MSVIKYSFYHLCNKEADGLSNKIVQEHLFKWSMKKCLHVNYYAFNQEFIPNNIEQFTMDFFRDNNVVKTLQSNLCQFVGSNVAKVKIEQIPCTITSMTFFDRLLDPDNNVVCNSTDKDGNRTIRQCMEVHKNGMYIGNNLKMMLFEDESEEYFLYSENERNEFVFKLFRHFVTGGKWCQDDTAIDPYLNATKHVYKDLLTVEKITDSDVQISTRTYKVEAFDSNKTVLFPKENTETVQYNFAYLAVNAKARTVALLYHNVGEIIHI